MYNKTDKTDYGLVAYNKIQELESKVYSKPNPTLVSAACVSGAPYYSLNNSLLQVATVNAKSSAVSFILKTTGAYDAKLYVNGQLVAFDNSGVAVLGVAAIESNVDSVVSIGGSGILETYNLLIIGDGLKVDQGTSFVLEDRAVFMCHNFRCSGFLEPDESTENCISSFETSGICADVIKTDYGYSVCVVDLSKNVWLILTDDDLRITDTNFLASNFTKATIAKQKDNLALAMLSENKVYYGTVINKRLISKHKLDFEYLVSDIKFVKHADIPTLVLTTTNNKSFIKTIEECTDYSEQLVLDISVEFSG